MAEETHETKIVITGDPKPAVGALSAVKTALHSVRAAVRGVVSAFGWIGLAIQGVQKLIELAKSLGEWINRTARESAQMRFAESVNAANAALDGTLERQKRLNELFRQENDAIARKNQLRDLEARNLKEIEDIRRAASRAAEIAGVSDPRTRMQIQQRWRVEDEKREREEQREGTYRAAADERERGDAIERQLTKNQKELDMVLSAKSKFGTARRGKNIVYEEGSDQYKERADKIAKFDEQIEKLRKAIETGRKDLEFSREKESLLSQQADRLWEVRKLNTTGWQNYDETAKFDAEESKKRAQEQEKIDKESARKDREEESELKKRQDDQRKILDSQIDIATDRRGDRLTAMGLGSGAVSGSRQNWRTVIDLLKKQIEATKDNKPLEQVTVFE